MPGSQSPLKDWYIWEGAHAGLSKSPLPSHTQCFSVGTIRGVLTETTFLSVWGGGGTEQPFMAVRKEHICFWLHGSCQDLWVLPLGLATSYKYQDHTLSSLTQGISVPTHHQLNVSLGPLYLDGTAFLQREKVAEYRTSHLQSTQEVSRYVFTVQRGRPKLKSRLCCCSFAGSL